MIRSREIERFIETVEALPEHIPGVDESLWAGLVDSMTVYSKDRSMFRLTCGMEIEVNSFSDQRLALAVRRLFCLPRNILSFESRGLMVYFIPMSQNLLFHIKSPCVRYCLLRCVMV